MNGGWRLATAFLPEIVLGLGAVAVLVRGPGAGARAVQAWGACAAWLAALAAWGAGGLVEGGVAGGMAMMDGPARWGGAAALGLLGTALWLPGWGRGVPEFTALALLAGIGLRGMAVASDFAVLFAAMETASVSGYALAAFRRDCRRSAEAGLKYLLTGGIASACMLFGWGFLWGGGGGRSFGGGGAHLASGTSGPAATAGLALLLGGLLFKLAAVPFQGWAPDVYAGAPLAAVGWVATASKVAAAVALARLGGAWMAEAPAGAWPMHADDWQRVLALAGIASVVLGNLGALPQTRFPRFLAFSAIAHAGYVAVGLSGLGGGGLAAALFYAPVYGAAVAGLLLVFVEAGGGVAGRDGLDVFDGLARRRPMLAWLAAVFVLSLAGLPPAAGFVGKIFLFLGCLEGRAGVWLGMGPVIVAAAMSCVGFCYYLWILKRLVMEGPGEGGPVCAVGAGGAWGGGLDARVRVGLALALAVFVIMVGVFPGGLLQSLREGVAVWMK